MLSIRMGPPNPNDGWGGAWKRPGKIIFMSLLACWWVQVTLAITIMHSRHDIMLWTFPICLLAAILAYFPFNSCCHFYYDPSMWRISFYNAQVHKRAHSPDLSASLKHLHTNSYTKSDGFNAPCAPFVSIITIFCRATTKSERTPVSYAPWTISGMYPKPKCYKYIWVCSEVELLNVSNEIQVWGTPGCRKTTLAKLLKVYILQKCVGDLCHHMALQKRNAG